MSDRHDELAKKIVDECWELSETGESPAELSESQLVQKIADALREAAKAPEGLDRLPVTDDGLAIFPGMSIYYPNGLSAAVLAVWFDKTLELQGYDENGMPTNSWKRLRFDGGAYSTREAAESARQGGKP